MAGQSENFGFLSAHDPQLVRLGALAERYFEDDPNTCLIGPTARAGLGNAARVPDRRAYGALRGAPAEGGAVKAEKFA